MKADLLLGYPGPPGKPDFQPPSGLNVRGVASIASPLPSPHWNYGAWGCLSYFGAVEKVVSPFLPPAAFLEGEDSRDVPCFCRFFWTDTIPCSGHNGD